MADSSDSDELDGENDDSLDDDRSDDDEKAKPTTVDTDLQSLPSTCILDGRFFELSKEIDGNKFLAKCKMCPNKLISAQRNALSNLTKHLKVGYFVKIISTVVSLQQARLDLPSILLTTN